MPKQNSKRNDVPHRKGATGKSKAEAARENGRKGGRPPLEIDWLQFDKLCALQCTLTEIAGWFGCQPETIERHVQDEKGMGFGEYFEQKSAPGKISLRRSQFQTAMGDPARGVSPNQTMQIWLGKQWLGQTDKQDVKHSGEVKGGALVGDPYKEFAELLIQLITKHGTFNELRNILEPLGVTLAEERHTRTSHSGNGDGEETALPE